MHPLRTGQPTEHSSWPYTVAQLPLLWPVCLWVTGLLLSRSDIVTPLTAALLLIGGLVLLTIYRRHYALILLLAALWGTADLLLDASRVSTGPEWLNGSISSTAVIHSVQQKGRQLRLQLQDLQQEGDKQSIGGSALLYVYPGQWPEPDKKPTTAQNEIGQPALQAGDRIRFTARWHRPENHLNPGYFDYQAWCFDHHIALIGSPRGRLQLLSRQPSLLESGQQRIRGALHNLPDQQAAILQALLLADRSQIKPSTNTAFAATGTAHLLAISGMHTGMAAAWFMALIWWLLTRREAWIIKLPVRTIALCAGLLAATAYTMIAGWPLPAMRALIMLAAAALAFTLSARHEPLNILLAALALILFMDPAAVRSLSLWLSFSATSALLLWLNRTMPAQQTEGLSQRTVQGIKSIAYISIIATLATLPITLTVFGRLPVYSLPANLLLVPVYSLLVMPFALLGELAAWLHATSLAHSLMSIAGLGIQLGIELLDRLLSLPAAITWAVKPALWQGIAYAGAMLLAGHFLVQKHQLKAAAIAAVTLAFYTASVLNERDIDEPRWLIWDVGQGAASTLLLPEQRVIVVDVPGRSGSRFNGGTTVADGLRNLGLTHVDILIISHAQSDHMGGAGSLLQSVNSIGEIWLADVAATREHPRIQALIRDATSRGTRIRWITRGDQVRLNANNSDHPATLSVLWPSRHWQSTNSNNSSLVIRASWNDTSLLWPGDIESPAEQQLVKAGILPVTAMLMPHHGSRTSSSMELLDVLQPELAFAQVAEHNHYNFPHPAIIKRYKHIGSRIETSSHGMLTVYWQGNKTVLSHWSEEEQSRQYLVEQWWLHHKVKSH